MYPVLFNIGPFTVYSFGSLMALAALMALWVVKSELKRRRYNPELASTMIVAGAVGGLLGARVFFILENWSSFLRSPLEWILSGAGFTWYGGFLGGLIAIVWVLRRSQVAWLVGADVSAPAVAIAYGIGRIGCHLAGDGDWGKISDVPWAVAYPNAIIGWVHPLTGAPYLPGVAVHPTPLYELAESLLIFGFLWSLRKRDYPNGTISGLYFVLAGIARFAVEFWRVNPVMALGMTQAQWFSLLLVVTGGSMLYRLATRPRT